MALTPDQKKRLAALDSGPEGPREDAGGPDGSMSSRVKSVGARIQASSVRTIAIKALIIVVLIGVTAYFIAINQFHRINFKRIISSGDGSPISRFVGEIKLQKKKAGLLDKGYGQLLVGEYDKALETAEQIRALDQEDPQPQTLISEIVDAVAQKAAREFEAGEIEAALKDVRTALRYGPNHTAANALYGDIADRLVLEANTHYEKKEYAELIRKAKEVQNIDQSNMAASILLSKANEELFAEASLLFVSKRYSESLEKVRLSLKIDSERTSNPGAHRLLDKITIQIASPELELRSITTYRGKHIARIRLSGARKLTAVEKGGRISNFKVIDIDPVQKSVLLEHIYTGKRKTILMKSLE